jgi:hypothetical protein
MNVVVVGNFDVKPGSVGPGFTQTGTWYEFFTGQPFEVTDLAETITLEAGEYKLYTDVQLETPQIGTGINDNNIEAESMMRVYPNPSADFSIEINLDKPSPLTLEVFDLAGRKVDDVFTGHLQGGLHQFRWSGDEAGLSRGIYLLKAASTLNISVSKLVYD